MQQPMTDAELLKDIHFINQAIQHETQRVEDRLHSSIAAHKLPPEIAEKLIAEISDQVGNLAARTELVERALATIKLNRKSGAMTLPGITQGKEHVTRKLFDAKQLSSNTNLLPLESSPDGVNYCWSGANPITTFTLPINRSEVVGMKIRLIAMIKPEYSKKLRIYVDGNHLNHTFRQEGKFFVLKCNLPQSVEQPNTVIEIRLPATHSPKELGSNQDERRLGVAITDISFGNPESKLTHYLKRLKLRKY